MSEILINGYLAEIDRLRRVTERTTEQVFARRSRTCSRTGRRAAGCISRRSSNTRRRSGPRSIPTGRCCTTCACRWADVKARAAGVGPRVILKADKAAERVTLDSETTLDRLPEEA